MTITIESATKFIILISAKNLNLISIVVDMNYHQLFEISLVLTLIILDGISSLADANHRRETILVEFFTIVHLFSKIPVLMFILSVCLSYPLCFWWNLDKHFFPLEPFIMESSKGMYRSYRKLCAS